MTIEPKLKTAKRPKFMDDFNYSGHLTKTSVYLALRYIKNEAFILYSLLPTMKHYRQYEKIKDYIDSVTK
jgi:hypothetical protein